MKSAFANSNAPIALSRWKRASISLLSMLTIWLLTSFCMGALFMFGPQQSGGWFDAPRTQFLIYLELVA
jgi:hypothetical protein